MLFLCGTVTVWKITIFDAIHLYQVLRYGIHKFLLTILISSPMNGNQNTIGDHFLHQWMEIEIQKEIIYCEIHNSLPIKRNETISIFFISYSLTKHPLNNWVWIYMITDTWGWISSYKWIARMGCSHYITQSGWCWTLTWNN